MPCVRISSAACFTGVSRWTTVGCFVITSLTFMAVTRALSRASGFRIARNSFPILKNGAFRAGTSTSAPVFGFSPVRGRRWRTPNVPSPRSSTRSPLTSAWTIRSNIAVTTVSLSSCVRPATRATSSIRSLLFMATP